MNIVGMAHMDAGSGLNLIRVHDGLVVMVPPNPPAIAADPHEALVALADWLGVATPGKPKTGSLNPRQRFPWAANSINVGVGSTLMLVRAHRGRDASEHGFIVTHHFASPNTVYQGVLWTPMAVLEHANEWMSAVPMQQQARIDAMRIVSTLDWESDEVFAIRVLPTSILAAEMPVPAREAPWTIVAEMPSLQCGIGAGPIAEHFSKALDGAVEGHFAARLRKNTLEIGQRLNPDLLNADEDAE